MLRHRYALAMVLLGLALCLSGCGSGGGASGGSRSLRPLVEAPAAEVARAQPAAGSSAELDFFDALESRRLVCHDDVLHAALLVGNGHSEPTPPLRLTLARRLGYVAADFNRPPLEAATAGELARLALRLTDGEAASRMNQEQSLMRLAALGWVPTSVKPYQGVTGAQLISVMAGVRAEIASRPLARVSLADVPPAAAIEAGSAPASAAATSGSSAVASADEAGGRPTGAGRGEPLPESARNPALEEPRPSSEPMWTPGRPLKRPE